MDSFFSNNFIVGGAPALDQEDGCDSNSSEHLGAHSSEGQGRLLLEETETLKLYKTIAEGLPDLLSLQSTTPEAPFIFVCDNFCHRMQLPREDILGQPLTSIVDPRDQNDLNMSLVQLLSIGKGGTGLGAGSVGSGTLVELRVVCNGISYQAGMTISIGSEGLIVVTRVYHMSA